jgi:uncharacterized protein (TIRG00374 family)
VSLARLLGRPIVWVPISVALLGFVAWRSRLWEVGDRLRLVDPGSVIAALLLNLVVLVLWAIRSADLLAASGHRVPVARLIPMTAFANTINNLTPGSGGEPIRVWLLNRHNGVDYAIGAAVVLIERLVAFGLLAGSAILLWAGSVGLVPGWLSGVGLLALAATPGGRPRPGALDACDHVAERGG